MNLVIDFGNTLTKHAAFDGNKMVRLWNPALYPKEKIFLHDVPVHFVKNAIYSSVSKHVPKLPPKMKNHLFIRLTHKTPLPIKNKYKTPKTLGNDRLANAVGATVIFPRKNVLVIDMGTCIKYDFIDKNKNYFGGAISPGMQMRFSALNHFTAKLPLIKSSKKFPLTGQSTQQSILSGVQNGIIFEINGAIEQYKKEHNELKVILTGGDHPFFANHLKSSIFAAPNLTLQGLNEILNYNVSKKT